MPHIRPRTLALPACLVGVASVYWAVIAVVSVEHIQSRGSFSDFAHFYAAARAVRMGLGPGIYSPALIERIDRLPGGCAGTSVQIPYLNPPLLAVLLQPLTSWSCGDAFRVWRVISLALWAGVTVLLAWQVWKWSTQRGASLQRSALSAAFIAALSAFSYTVLDGLWLGQAHLLILAGIVYAWWLRERNHPVACGIVLAFITCIKLVPAVLILYFLLRRDWRVVAGVLVGSGVLLVIMLLGAGGLPTLLAAIPPLTSAAGLLPADNKAVIKLNPVLGPAIAVAAALVFAGMVLLAERTGGAKEEPLLGYAWAASTMLVVSPIVWLHYLTWLLPVIAACIPFVRGRALTLALGAASVAVLLPRPQLLNLIPIAILLCWSLVGLLYVRSVDPSGLHRRTLARWLAALGRGRHPVNATVSGRGSRGG